MANLPIDDLINPPAPPPAPLRLTQKEPINLPSFTFLIGDLMNCYMFANELNAQSTFVYEEDFHAPIYEALTVLHEFSVFVTPHEIATKYAADVLAIRNAVNINLVERFMHRAEELLSFLPYQIVVRDTKGFIIPPIKDCIIVNFDSNRLYRGVPNNDSLILPPDADMMKELRNFCA